MSSGVRKAGAGAKPLVRRTDGIGTVIITRVISGCQTDACGSTSVYGRPNEHLRFSDRLFFCSHFPRLFWEGGVKRRPTTKSQRPPRGPKLPFQLPGGVFVFFEEAMSISRSEQAMASGTGDERIVVISENLFTIGVMFCRTTVHSLYPVFFSFKGYHEPQGRGRVSICI